MTHQGEKHNMRKYIIHTNRKKNTSAVCDQNAAHIVVKKKIKFDITINRELCTAICILFIFQNIYINIINSRYEY